MVLGVEGKNFSEIEESDIRRVWLKFYDPHVRKDIEIPEVPLYDLLEKSAERKPQNVLCDFLGKIITYREANEFEEE